MQKKLFTGKIPASLIALFLASVLTIFAACSAGNPSEEGAGPSPAGPSDLGMRLGSIDLSWTDNSSSELGFIIERKIGSNGAWQEIGRVGANVTEFVDNYYIREDVPAFYRVAAYNNNGISPYSNITFVNSILWSGYRDVKVSGNYAYCSSSNGLVVFNISDPSNPQKVSSLALGAKGSAGNWMTIQKILLSGNYVYIPFGQAGIKVINVSDPSNPTLTSTFATSGYAESIFLETRGAKTYGYISEYSYAQGSFMGLEVADFTDISNPVFVAKRDFGFIGYSYVKNGFAYVVDGFGFTVLDVSSLPNLPEVGTYRPLVDDVYYDITVKDDVAYVSYFLSDPAAFGFDTVDISIPALPDYMDFYERTGYGFGVPTIYLDSDWDVAYLVGADIYIADVTDPSAVVTTGTFIDMYYGANNISKVGDVLYVAEESGLEAYNLQFYNTHPITVNLDTFGRLGGYWTPDYITDVEIQSRSDLNKKFAYLATTTSGLKVVDITDASAPLVVYETPLTGATPWVEKVMVKGNYLYTTSFYAMTIYDITNPYYPAVRFEYPIDRDYDFMEFYDDGIAISGDYMFICENGAANFIDIVDISDPSHPVSVGHYPVSIAPFTIFIDGQYGYIGEGDGLEIVSISGSNVTQVSKTVDDHVSKILVSGNLLYYTNISSFAVMDVTSKTAPVKLPGSYTLPPQSDVFFLPFNFIKDGNNVYVPTLLDEIIKLDVSNPSSIQKVGDVPTPGIPLNLVIDNGAFIIADMYSLLTIK